MKRRRRTGPEITLFPFLSVLFCATGVIVFVMTGMSLLMLEGPIDQVVQSRANASGQTPVYVECTADAAIIHPGGTRVPASALGASDPSAFDALVQQLREDHSRYIVLLLRPQGIVTYERCRLIAEGHGLTLAKDAVFAEGALLFDNRGEPVENRRLR